MLKKLAFILCLFPLFLIAQHEEKFTNPRRDNKTIRIVFYNVENLFDTIDDPKTNDDDFLPNGKYHWTSWKYWHKQNNIAKALFAVGGWEPPDIIGLAEIENRQVLIHLTGSTSLKNYHYEIVHKDSPDKRGMDVALIYRPEKFQVITFKVFPIIFPDTNKLTTRDILYIKGLLLNKDTVHLFVNHWPSRMGGQAKSERLRMFVASVLRTKVDSLKNANPLSDIVVMGDLNDEPTDISISEILKAKKDTIHLKSADLFNLMYSLEKKGEGTLVYKNKTGENYYLFDQFIISANLLDKNNRLTITPDKARIFKADFLLTESKSGLKKPYRTYQGYKFIGGYSDHLPVYLDLIIK